ncbi:MAG: hypothetical protein LUE93_13115 [Bacteroides sp.]|nr:hypothetical protein [Bacteroides sp.]
MWDEVHQKVYVLDSRSGLLNNFVFAILEDDNGVLWASSVNGISRIEVKEEKGSYEFPVLNFNSLDGLQGGKFNVGAAMKAGDGTFYFGGVHGFNSFNPRDMAMNPSKNKPVFTRFSLFNTPVRENIPYQGNMILESPVGKTERITLKHNENFITLEFAGLNYVDPSRTYFRYKLEGFDTDWNEIVTAGEGKVTYTGLRPGSYQLIVYTANNDKVWGGDEPAVMSLIIRPPFWATPMAVGLYFVLLVALVIWMVNFFTRRTRRKMAEQRLLSERRQKEELDQMKYRFFTNVSHEFRTPLTLILMPLETWMKQGEEMIPRERLISIYNSARELLTLVNQLLDFRKLEMQGEALKPVRVNVEEFIRTIYHQFRDSTAAKNIHFVFEYEAEPLCIYLDDNKIHKVINNLLSNSLKYTPAGGEHQPGSKYPGPGRKELAENIGG